jgi:hypothetical protein
MESKGIENKKNKKNWTNGKPDKPRSSQAYEAFTDEKGERRSVNISSIMGEVFKDPVASRNKIHQMIMD